jgi:mannose/fructose/N-acetylgalactosamine-specific phosphotransferase system component IID
MATTESAGVPRFSDAFNSAGRALLRAILPAVFVLITGLLAAKNLDESKTVLTTAVIAIIVAAAGALQAFVPQLSWRAYVPEGYAKYLDAFTQAFVGTFLTLLTGWLTAPDFSFTTSALTAVIVGALTAAVRAVQALATPGEPLVEGKV